MKRLPGPHQRIFTLTERVYGFVEIKIKEHRESFDPSSQRDYIDCFLTEMGDVSVFICLCFFFFSLYSIMKSVMQYQTLLYLLCY